jgi:hypothetical protein
MTTGAMGDDESLLTEQDVAELLPVELSALRRWHREGAGPPHAVGIPAPSSCCFLASLAGESASR